MNRNSEWNAIAARIDGLVSAGQFFVQTLAINSSDAYSVTTLLAKEAKDIVSSLEAFLAAHHGNIPEQATVALTGFLEKYGVQIKHDGVKGIDGLKLRITSLASVKSALAYHFTNFEALAHRRAERAFLHLNQTIVADEVAKDSWLRAFNDAEPN